MRKPTTHNGKDYTEMTDAELAEEFRIRRARGIAATQRWRQNHPDKYREYLDRQNAKGREMRALYKEHQAANEDQ